MRVSTPWFAAGSVLLAACGSSATFIQTRQLTLLPEARTPESVELFTAGPPTRPYVEHGIIEGSQDTHLSADGTAEILASMRAMAGKCGCDALVLAGSANRDGIDFDGNVRTVQGLRGTCIVWSTGADTRSKDAP